jgi:hypothetical protein
MKKREVRLIHQGMSHALLISIERKPASCSFKLALQKTGPIIIKGAPKLKYINMGAGPLLHGGPKIL